MRKLSMITLLFTITFAVPSYSQAQSMTGGAGLPPVLTPPVGSYPKPLSGPPPPTLANEQWAKQHNKILLNIIRFITNDTEQVQLLGYENELSLDEFGKMSLRIQALESIFSGP